jgi:Ca2+:H+ antiporter
MIVAGVYSHEQSHNSTVAITLSSLAQIGPFFSVLLYFFNITAIGSPSTDALSGILTISMAEAVISIILYLTYFYFRSFSHRSLFDAESVDHFDADAVRANAHESSARMYLLSLLFLLLILVLMIFVSESVYRAANLTFSSFQTAFGLLILPLAIKIWTWLELLQRAPSHYQFDAIIEETAGASIHMSLLFAPALVLLGRVQDVPMTLHFGLLESFTYGLRSLLLTSVLPRGVSNYLNGLLLVGTYLLLAFANILNWR